MRGRMRSTALGVAVILDNLQVPSAGNLERERQSRLVKVVGNLLRFWPEAKVRKWMLKKNPGFRGERPIDLVSSGYATEDLLSAIREMKQRHLAEKKQSRLNRLMTEPSVLEGSGLAKSDLPVELL